MTSKMLLWVAAFLVLALVAWFAFDSPAKVRGVASPAPTATASPQAEPASELEPITDNVAASRTDLSSDAYAEPTAPDSAPEKDTSASGALLYGFVRPDPLFPKLFETPTIAATNALGERFVGACGADGAYSIPNLAPGPWWILASSRRDGEAFVLVDLDDSSSELRFDVKLAAVPQVLVKVIDLAGEPIIGRAFVPIATTAPPGEWFDEVVGSFNNAFGVGEFDFDYGEEYTDALGAASRDEGYIGRLRFHSEPPVYVSLVNYQRTIATQRVERDQREVVFRVDANSPLLRRPSLRGRFVDAETHDPLTKAVVLLQGAMTRMGTLDDHGAFEMPNCATGWSILSVRAMGYENCDRCFRVEPGEDIDLGDIEVGTALSIEGVIVDEQGHGVATSVEYGLIDPATDRIRRVGLRYSTNSGEDGSFRISGLSPQRYSLRVWKNDHEWSPVAQDFDMSLGSFENVRFEVARAVPVSVRPSGERWRDVFYRFFDASGACVVDSRLWSAAPYKLGLAPGVYELEVAVGKAPPSRRSLVISGDPMQLALP